MGYVERHLLPDERVVYKTRVHWVVFVRPMVVVVAGLTVTWLLRGVEHPAWSWMLGAAIAGAGLAWFLARVIEVQTSEFAVTSTRLILKVGLVWRYTTELLLSKGRDDRRRTEPARAPPELRRSHGDRHGRRPRDVQAGAGPDGAPEPRPGGLDRPRAVSVSADPR
jgi:hypothetical protein